MGRPAVVQVRASMSAGRPCAAGFAALAACQLRLTVSVRSQIPLRSFGAVAEDATAQALEVRPVVRGQHFGWPRDRRLEGTYVFAHAQPFLAFARSLSSSLTAFCN